MDAAAADELLIAFTMVRTDDGGFVTLRNL